MLARLLSFNRTFMELKLRVDFKAFLRLSVLIVPLWNWNPLKTESNGADFSVLIVPLWNWNKQTD